MRDGQIVADDWSLVLEGEATPGVIAPFDAWARNPEGAGAWLDGDVDGGTVGEALVGAPVVAVRFPAFADGRGLSLATLLRSRYGFEGELRAFGDIVPDLTEYMHRCGFNAFVLASQAQAETAIACIQRMSEHYQASVRAPWPRFRAGYIQEQP